MANNVPPPNAFSYSVPDSTAILERFFTQDQCQSLQRLLSVQQSYLFQCLYEMETHLELTLEELKKKLVKTEGQTTRLLLLAETTRDGLITLSHRIDEIDSHQHQKCKRAYTTSSAHESEHATKQTSNAPVCSDNSTLLGGNPKDASKKPSGSFLIRALLAPIEHRLNCDSDTGTNNPSSSQIAQNFASAPAVSSNLAPVKQWIAPVPDSNSGPEPVSGAIVQDSEPALSATSGAHDAPQPDLQPPQELESEHERGTESELQRYRSHPQFPPLSPDDMNLTTANEQAGPSCGLEEDEEEEEEEEIVVMQLVNTTPCSTSRPPTPLDLPKLRVDSPDAATPLVSPFAQLPSLLPNSPPPLPSLPSSPAQSQPHTSTPSPPHDEISEAHESTPVQAKSEAPEPAPLTLDPKEAESYFLDLTRSLSPLSELTDMSSAGSVVDFAEKRDDTESCPGTSTSISGLNGVAPSDVLTKSVVTRLEKNQALKSKKRVMIVEKKKHGRKRLDKRMDGKREVVEQKKKSLKGSDKPSGKKRDQRQKVKWPEAYGGDEDGFYKKLIECDSCSCWYHYGCAGIKPKDVRLNSSELFVCPVCTTHGENKMKGRSTCSRPDCRRSEQPGEYFVSGIAGRKLRYDEKGNIRFLYLVKWDGYSVADATWEFEDGMPDPQNLIREFNEACQREGLSLDSSEPILLQEAVAVGWLHVLEFTDPPGKQVPLA